MGLLINAKALKEGDKRAQKKFEKLMNGNNELFVRVYTLWQWDQYDLYSEKEDSTFIHSKEYVPMKCCLCGADMPTIHDTHNPEPFTPRTYAKEALLDSLPHRCCGKCNLEKVTPARFGVESIDQLKPKKMSIINKNQILDRPTF